MIRLNKFLAQCGIGSRRKCDEFIAAGHVYRNGKRVTELGLRIDPDQDRIEYRGKEVKRIQLLEYFAYYKPREVLVTAEDPQGRPTLYTALRKSWKDVRHLRYVGRLDYQSEGLLLLTSDGALIHALTHPRFHVKKVYHVKVERRLTENERARLCTGVTSEETLLKAGSVHELSLPEKGRKQYWYEIVLFEGKNRQIRRMFEVLNVLVGRIRRVQFGSVKMGPLQPGEVRPLTPREIGGLRNTGYR
jgi:23S rRNA pseudouridine2605 synthase